MPVVLLVATVIPCGICQYYARPWLQKSHRTRCILSCRRKCSRLCICLPPTCASLSISACTISKVAGSMMAGYLCSTKQLGTCPMFFTTFFIRKFVVKVFPASVVECFCGWTGSRAIRNPGKIPFYLITLHLAKKKPINIPRLSRGFYINGL